LPPAEAGYPPVGGWVAPFGYLRINCYLHIPAACRSLSRPSSPQRAKASSVRPYLLSLALGTIIPDDTGFLLYAFLLKLCFFQHVNELYPSGYEDLKGIEPYPFIVPPGKPK
jgi:hypothetical protein